MPHASASKKKKKKKITEKSYIHTHSDDSVRYCWQFQFSRQVDRMVAMVCRCGRLSVSPKMNYPFPQGFSVDGQENIQEILSKQLYLCQFLTALNIVRTGELMNSIIYDTAFGVRCCDSAL